jgi:hypothetical protein
MSTFYGNQIPSVGPLHTTTPRDILINERGSMCFPGGVVVDGSKSRDTGNTSNVQTLRCGMLMGRISASNKYAPSAVGGLGSAYASGTTMVVSAAVATEIVRRFGASGTFKLTGPPVAAGTVRTVTVTYSSVNTTTGDITITALPAPSTWTLTEAADTDGGTFKIRVTTPDGVSATTGALAYNVSNTDMDTALEALTNVGTGGVAATGSAGGPYTLTFASTLGDVQVEIVNDATTDGGVWEGGIVVAQTVVGVDGRFVVGSLVQPTDGSESVRGIMGVQFGLTVTDVYQDNIDVQLESLLTGGQINPAYIVYWPADTSLQAWILAQLRAVGFGYINEDDFIS